MKIRYIHILIAGALLFTSVSCKKALDESNVNPNASETAQPDYLLTAAIKSTSDTYWGTTNNFYQCKLPGALVCWLFQRSDQPEPDH
jgi:hypothetical protein